jgi:hypothetical protein
MLNKLLQQEFGIHNQDLNVMQSTKERNAHVLQLTTNKKRPDAIRFYEAIGFKASHEGMKMHF